MGDAADMMFDKVIEDEMFHKYCEIHRIEYDERFGCSMCEDGDPPVKEII